MNVSSDVNETVCNWPGETTAPDFHEEVIFLIVLLLTKDMARFSLLEAGLVHRRELEMVSAATGIDGFLLVKNKQIDLAIVDEQLGDMDGIIFVKQLVKINPLINTAIVSALSAEEFHEATEGLGVLMQLPKEPQEKDATTLLAILEKICVLLQPMARQQQKAAKS
jgi:DNA-binding NarL/FixJ family response regulator